MSGRDDRPPDGPAVGPPSGAEPERRLRESLARAESRAAPSADAERPSPEALHEALAGRLSEEERLRVIDRAARTAEGRRELATLHVALGASEAAWPADGKERARRAAWWLRPELAAAAAIVIAAGLGGGVWWEMLHRSPNTPAAADPLRAAGTEARVTLVAPVVEAPAGAPPTLVWRAVPGAAAYDVEVLARDGALVHRASTRDTALALPAAAAPAPGAEYEWWVRARLDDGTARRSATGRIRGR